MENRQLVYMLGSILTIGATLGYIFWSHDLIPDTLVTVPMASLIAYLDDAIAVVGMIFILRKWKLSIFKKKVKSKTFNIFHTIPLIAIATSVIFYVFWGVDLIHDAIPFAGHIDDAMIVILGIYAAGKLRQQFFPKRR